MKTYFGMKQFNFLFLILLIWFNLSILISAKVPGDNSQVVSVIKNEDEVCEIVKDDASKKSVVDKTVKLSNTGDNKFKFFFLFFSSK